MMTNGIVNRSENWLQASSQVTGHIEKVDTDPE